jgi:hypothetical protein
MNPQGVNRKQIIADYICLNNNEFQNSMPNVYNQFHIICGLKTEMSEHKIPLILQGRLPEVIEYITFELDDYLNLFNDNRYKHSSGRIDIFNFVKQKPKQKLLNSQGLPINLEENLIQTIQDNYLLDDMQTMQGLLKATTHTDTQPIRNIFTQETRYI